MSIKQIALVIILAVAAVFVLQNTPIIDVRMLSWKVSASRALVLVITFLLGMAAEFLLKVLWKRAPDSGSR